MMYGGWWQIVRNFLFSKANREFLIFLFFVGLSGVFWLFMTLNETYEREFAIPVQVVGIPKNVVLTSEEVDTVRMTIRDKGFTIATYEYGDLLPKILVDFKTHTHTTGTGIITAQELQKLVYHHLASGSKIISAKPDRLEFSYNYGAKKLVPVRWSGRVIPEELYFISHVEYSPDSVTIYASEEKLDSITTVYTEPLNYVSFRDTLSIDCRLKKIKDVKMVPDQVNVSFFTDVLTEERIEGIPIKGINLPEGKVLRTFPAKVAITFVTGVSLYRNLRPEDFTVVADYKELKAHPSEKCRLYLRNVPQGISRARLETTTVDYLIEEQTTTE
ncbi:MAG: YbbR-like domain-containing protein [Prevotella sp.]|nr:YbbR-like domain-containing protein [Prevotella sp.]